MAKIEIFGDSILKGVMWSGEQNKYKLCRYNKFENLKERNIEVRNNSKMGATADKIVEIINARLPENSNGNTVILEFGGNDCDFIWKDISENPCGNFLPHTPLEKFVPLFHKAVSEVKKRGGIPVICTLAPIDAEKYLDFISRGLNRENILRWLGDTSMLYRYQELYSRTAEEEANKLGCRIIDLRSAFLKSQNFKNLICDDGIHPTEAGHKIICDKISEFAV